MGCPLGVFGGIPSTLTSTLLQEANNIINAVINKIIYLCFLAIIYPSNLKIQELLPG
jgi:hypothetical protein